MLAAAALLVLALAEKAAQPDTASSAEAPDLQQLCFEQGCTSEQCMGPDGVCVRYCWTSMTEQRRDELGLVLCKGAAAWNEEHSGAARTPAATGAVDTPAISFTAAAAIAGATAGLAALVAALYCLYTRKVRGKAPSAPGQGLPLKFGAPVKEDSESVDCYTGLP